MIINPIAIATSGVYANDISLGLASFGYIDIDQVEPEVILAPSGGGSMWGRDESKRILDDDKVIMLVIKQFLDLVGDAQND